MAAEGDLGFTFDTSFFDKGIKKVMGGFGQMETEASTVAKGVSIGLTAVIGKLGLLFAGFKTIKTALLNMPEVGQAFGIAKDVFMKNLLYPLRKEIFPLLQKMLDWVRDSRGKFVKWGQHLANVFRAVVQGVKNIIEFVKRMSIIVSGFAEKIFGDRIKSIEDIFNLVVFKIAVVVQFVSLLIEQLGGLFSGFFSGLGDIAIPLKGIGQSLGDFLSIFTQANDEGDSFKSVLSSIGTLLGQMVGFIVQMTDKFLDGFVPAISQIMTPLQEIEDSILSIFNSLFGSTEQLEKWEGIFKELGEIVGTGILKTFEFIATVLKDIDETIKSIKDIGFMGTLTEQTGNLYDALQSKLFGRGVTEIQDGIIKPDGSIIKTDPQDTLIALKDKGKSLNELFKDTQSGSIENSFSTSNVEKNFSTSVDFTGMQIVVQNGGIEEGQEFAMGLIEQMRNEFNSEFERYALG